MDHLWSRLRAKGPQNPFVLDVINYAAGWRPGSRQAEAYAQRAVREAADDFAAIFETLGIYSDDEVIEWAAEAIGRLRIPGANGEAIVAPRVIRVRRPRA